MSERKTFVVGHRNPDTDSIVSAVAYAELLRLQGLTGVVAARQGEVWRETRYILDRFGLPLPLLIEDVRPHTMDVMNPRPVVGQPGESVYRVGRRLRERQIRAVCVVDDDGRLAGLIGVEDFANILLTGLGDDRLDEIHLDVHNVVETLGGRLLVEAHDRLLRDKVFVGAMSIESIHRRVEPDIMIVMGDRENAQRAAILDGVGALVITGDEAVSDEIVTLAREKNVTLIASPHHTFTTVRLLNLSIPVSYVMSVDVLTSSPDDSLDDLRAKLSRQRSIPVVEADGRLVGVVSRTDLLNPVRHGVYLVDHNERSQTVDGLDEAELLGIVDHHRIADIQTAVPILFRNDIVGSTSTIIAGLFEEAGISIPPSIAGILLGGLITDTVLFRSPTTTPRDQRVAQMLAAVAEVDVEAFGGDVFSIASDLSGRTPREIITTDFKEFRIDEVPFAIGYLETVHKQRVDEIRDGLLAEMQAIQGQKGYASLLLMIVDIVHGETEILIQGMEQAVAEVLGQSLVAPHTVIVGGVLSRKKQIVPILPIVARRWRGRS
jgi:manganese-dependent inorganic pyrophosphatase